MKIEKKQSQWCVLDWNIIRSMSADCDIPDGFQCVILDQTFHEIANSPAGDDGTETWPKWIQKFAKWGRKNSHRLWIAKSPEHLFEIQFADERKLRCWDVMHAEFTEQVRKNLDSPAFDWVNELRKIRRNETDRAISKRKEKLVDMWHHLDAVKADVLARGERVPQTEQQKAAFCSDYKFLADFFAQISHRGIGMGYVLPNWAKKIEQNINQYAFSRWTRLMWWYSLHVTTGKNIKFENCYDDAHYALLASYTGLLATKDKGLRTAARTLFKGICIWPPDPPTTAAESPPPAPVASPAQPAPPPSSPPPSPTADSTNAAAH